MDSYNWGYMSPSMAYKYSYPTYSPIYNYPPPSSLHKERCLATAKACFPLTENSFKASELMLASADHG